ncbi:MAG: hypothetical protein SFX73_32245, partial [Kofleriaceae bacterium]|nr:hypothetical protein [Kofleriaceae bacterium]
MRLGCLLLVVGCGSDARPPAPVAARVSVQVTCETGAKQLEVTRDVQLDDALCGAPWRALQLESPARTEIVRAQAAREIWLRRAIDRAFVEVRTPGHPTSKIDRVTAIRWIGEQAAGPGGIAIVHAGTTRHVGFQELKRQYGADSQRVSEVSLCRVADDFGNKPSKITVVGDDG